MVLRLLNIYSCHLCYCYLSYNRGYTVFESLFKLTRVCPCTSNCNFLLSSINEQFIFHTFKFSVAKHYLNCNQIVFGPETIEKRLKVVHRKWTTAAWCPFLCLEERYPTKLGHDVLTLVWTHPLPGGLFSIGCTCPRLGVICIR